MLNMINEMTKNVGDSVPLTDEELKLVLMGLGELPAKMSVRLLLRLEKTLIERQDGLQEGQPDGD